MSEEKELSVLSEFLEKKVDEKGWSKKEFAEKTGLSLAYAYEVLSEKRDSILSDETLEKLSSGLELSEEDRKYIYDLTEKEREKGGLIYPSDIEEPAEPDEPEDPPVQPEPEEPVEPDEPEDPPVQPDPEEPVEPDKPDPDEPGEPDEPIQPPAPKPDPQPPAPVPGGDMVVPWSHKKVIVALVVGLAGGLLIGCCSASTILPIILSGIGF